MFPPHREAAETPDTSRAASLGAVAGRGSRFDAAPSVAERRVLRPRPHSR